MNILAIDTSTSFASIAVAVDDRIVGESLVNTDRTLSARLMSEIERILATAGLALSDIDLFASSVGPGSFTGVRGGVATVQGLALATGRPCAGFSSLAMLSMNFSYSSMPVCPMLDARKSEVYAALYDCRAAVPVSRLSDRVLAPAAFLDQIAAGTADRVIFTGDGAVRYRDLIAGRLGDQAVFAPFPLQTPRAANGILLARQGAMLEPQQLLPVYLRSSDAEINLAAKKAAAG